MIARSSLLLKYGWNIIMQPARLYIIPPVICHTFICFVKEIFSHLPKQRKLAHEEKIEARALLQLKVNKKLLQQHLRTTTGKVVTLKDISNIQSEVNADCNLDALVTRLRESEGTTMLLYTCLLHRYLFVITCPTVQSEGIMW